MTPAVSMVAVDALIPYARNARTHSDAQVAQIACGIVAFGRTSPIYIDGDVGTQLPWVKQAQGKTINKPGLIHV